MKLLLTILLLFVASADSYAQENNCTQYHTGKFTYTDSAGDIIMVKRKKKFQVETNEANNVWVNFRIIWKSDCEYQLEQVGTNSKSRRKYNHTFSSTIISKPLGNMGYEYTCACNDETVPKIKGVMKKVND